MLNTCQYCNKELSKTQTLYFGFDHVCCSAICRTQLSKIINSKDPRLFYPENWKIISKKRNSIDLEKLDINEDSIQENNVTHIKKTKSYKKEVSELIMNENTYKYYYNYDISCNIIFNTFMTLREYFNFANLTSNSLFKTTILFSPSNIFTKLHF